MNTARRCRSKRLVKKIFPMMTKCFYAGASRPHKNVKRGAKVSGLCFLLAAVLSPSLPMDGCALAAEDDARGQILSRQDIRAKVNTGGPEDWPEAGGLSTVSPVPPSGGSVSPPVAEQDMPSAPAVLPAEAVSEQPSGQSVSETSPVVRQGASATGTVSGEVTGLPVMAVPEEMQEEAQPPHEVIYVDEQGNPVTKPPEPDTMLAEAERLMAEGKYSEALPQLEQIRALPVIPREMREKVLYHISDCVWACYSDKPLAGYEAIDSTTKEAMNANLRSPRVPDALLRLGLANCSVGNLTEGEAYVKALIRRHPDYPGVAQGFTALGEEQLRQGRNAEAEKSFGVVLDEYPEAAELQAASVGLAQALHRQGEHRKTRIILDFVNKRWPRYYIEDPDFLLMQASNEEALKQISPALDTYWLYVNLEPGRKGNDVLMLKMGDIYTRQGNKNAADFVYTEIDRRFPDSQAAVTARLRLAEKGIYESPLDYETMRKVFAQESESPLWQAYCDLVASSDRVPDAVLARLKQAMWLYWDKQYTEAMGKAADFIDAYPGHADVAAARDVIWQAFRKEMDNALAEENYGRILILWNGFPLVRERYGEIDPDLRYALARGWLERGDDQKGFELLGGFLQGVMDSKYGEAAFTEFFNRYLQVGAWRQILDLARLVENWKLKEELRRQLDYAMALSAQNLNLGGLALSLWKKLAERTDIPLYQQAYATYFLARDAENSKDIRNAYLLNKKVIELFGQLQDERSDKADPQRIKEAIASLMDICEVGNRVPEALEWLKRYNTFVPENSPEYPGLRFREARLYRKLGDSNRAQALLEDVARNHADSPYAQAAQGELRSFEVSRDLQSFTPGVGARQNTGEQKADSGPGASNSTWSWQQPAAQQQQ